MSARPTPAHLALAKRVVRAVEGHGAVHQDDLLAALGCRHDELRIAVGIAYHWRRVDRCFDWLVIPARREGRSAA